ncbi:MAG: hypothetical protein LJE96_21445 [Deltaproteobacteria bacterium]|nr:hypothetical protein [Deltaproteobacteria bacterium]
MALFGKDKIPEKEAAKGFLTHIAQYFQKHWSVTVNNLIEGLPAANSISDHENTQTEFFSQLLLFKFRHLRISLVGIKQCESEDI